MYQKPPVNVSSMVPYLRARYKSHARSVEAVDRERRQQLSELDGPGLANFLVDVVRSPSGPANEVKADVLRCFSLDHIPKLLTDPETASKALWCVPRLDLGEFIIGLLKSSFLPGAVRKIVGEGEASSKFLCMETLALLGIHKNSVKMIEIVALLGEIKAQCSQEQFVDSLVFASRMGFKSIDFPSGLLTEWLSDASSHIDLAKAQVLFTALKKMKCPRGCFNHVAHPKVMDELREHGTPGEIAQVLGLYARGSICSNTIDRLMDDKIIMFVNQNGSVEDKLRLKAGLEKISHWKKIQEDNQLRLGSSSASTAPSTTDLVEQACEVTNIEPQVIPRATIEIPAGRLRWADMFDSDCDL